MEENNQKEQIADLNSPTSGPSAQQQQQFETDEFRIKGFFK